jgi:hypothetical protein
MTELNSEQKQLKSQLLEELIALNGRRSLKPTIQDNGRTREVMNQLYELTGNNIYKIN